MLNKSFEIHHTWGDPREPEYRNGSMVSFAHYKEGNVHLLFSMHQLKSDGISSIVMEIPANIRMSLCNDWSKCEIVIRRVADYLTSLDESKSHRKYSDIVIDTSKVPKWLPTQIKLLEKSYPFLVDSLPTASTSPLIALGLAIGYQKEYHLLGDLSVEATDWAIGAVGTSIMGILFSDIYKRWIFYYRHPLILPSRTWTISDTFAGTFKRYWRRFLVTFCLSLLAISEGLK
jgi:hypothetical protein